MADETGPGRPREPLDDLRGNEHPETQQPAIPAETDDGGRVPYETHRQTSALSADVDSLRAETGPGSAIDQMPSAEAEPATAGESEKKDREPKNFLEKALAGVGLGGGVGKAMELLKKITSRLDPIREKLAKLIGPLFGSETYEQIKGWIAIPTLGLLGPLEKFLGGYGPFYKTLAKYKIVVGDEGFSAKAFLAQYKEATGKGMKLSLDAFTENVATTLRRQKGAGADAETVVTAQELSDAGKTVADRALATGEAPRQQPTPDTAPTGAPVAEAAERKTDERTAQK